MIKTKALIVLIFSAVSQLFSQNLVVSGAISNSNANWNGQEAPWNGTTYQNSYLAACGNNYVMEVDNASVPTQTVNGFTNGAVYVLSFRYAYRTAGCGPSNNPTFLRIRFSDATAVLDYTLSIPNTVTTFATFSYTFTNDASASHTLAFTNPGNVNTCGVIVDDISLMKFASPGGIGTSSISYWIKAESIGLPDNSNVYGWLSQGNNVIQTTKCADLPVYKTGLASAANNLVANYNPYVTFNGTNQYLEYTATRVDFMDNSAGGNGGSFFSVYQGGSTNRSYFGHQGLNNSRVWGKTDSLIYANNTSVGTNNNMRYTVGTRVNLVSSAGKSNGITTGDLNGTTQTLVNKSGDADYLTIGVRRNGAGAYSGYFNSNLSEIMVFNNVLTSTQMQQVRSYLATKYGVTLSDNTSTGIDERTYLATDGTTNYWDNTANASYHNNVTIIGRDDATALSQTISISTNADAGSNTGNGMLIIDNGTSISADKSFLAVGHNGTVIANPGGANFFDVPFGIQSRLQRVWKFQKTGTGIANSIIAKFDMTGFSPLTGSDLRLLVSNSPTFVGANIITGAYAAPYFTVSLPTTGGVYFTIGSINLATTPLPITLLSFDAQPENGNVLLNWSTATEMNSDFFTIERSSDAINFTELTTVKAAFNSSNRKNYTAIDNKALAGTSYYRLKLTNTDASTETFNIVSILFEDKAPTVFSLYPNPNKGEFMLDFSGIENNHEVQIIISDINGSVVYDNVFYSKTISQNQVKLNLSEKAPPGTYFCTIVFEGISKKIKLIVD